MENIVYLNGSLIPGSEARISVTDYGFLFGYGLFETMRAYGGKVFRLDHHIDRLVRCARVLDIQVEPGPLPKAVAETLEANGLEEARVRLTVSPGEGSLVPDPGSCRAPTVIIFATRYTPYPAEVYQKGFRLIISSFSRNSRSSILPMKTANYLENLLARKEAASAGAQEALMLNENGQLTEASMSNVFMVNHGIIKTPRLENGILPGITREAVLELAPQLGLKAVESDIKRDELMAADEVFLTNSLMEIMPVAEINGNKTGKGKPGTNTNLLINAYKKLVIKETGLI